MRLLNPLVLASTLLCCAVPARAGNDVPAWLRAAAAGECPEYGPRVDAVVLLSDETVRIERDGRAVFRTRFAVRTLRREGALHAIAHIVYRTDGGGVRGLHGWVIPPRGAPHAFKDENVADVAALDGGMYNELRARVLDASGEMVEGAVFGYEAEHEDRGIVTQYEWNVQGELPVLRAHLSVTTPPGWRVEGVMINHEPTEPRLVEGAYEWDLLDLPPIPDELYRPPTTELAPRLALSVFPPPNERGGGALAFRAWGEVSRWLSGLADPRAEATGAVAARARDLASHAGTERERIQAVGRFVQGLTYASVQLGTRYGGGYIPRPAGQVLAQGYGDCKDKANLMKALLRALGIQAYLVLIYLGDREYVRDSWPSPYQFNHCIVAVRVAGPFDGPVYRHPALGPLLLFDPTDPDVPLGSLPEEEQASLALLIAGDDGALLHVPELGETGDANRRRVDAHLETDGSIRARISERSTGEFANAERRLLRRTPRSDYRKLLERWVSQGAAGTEVVRFEAGEEDSARVFTLDVEVTARRYARTVGTNMLAARPILLDRGEVVVFPDPDRKLPVMLRHAALEETTRTLLPAGFAVKEIPQRVALDAPFGSYRLECQVDRDTLVVTRSYRIFSARVPPEKYASLREFFAAIHAAEQRSVVLSRD